MHVPMLPKAFRQQAPEELDAKRLDGLCREAARKGLIVFFVPHETWVWSVWMARAPAGMTS